MRTFLLFISLLWASCAPAAPPTQAPRPSAVAQSVQAPSQPLPEKVAHTPPRPEPISPSIPQSLAPETTAPAVWKGTLSGIDLLAVTFDSRAHTLRIVDQPQGPGSSFSTAKDATLPLSGIAGINAGFFTPDGGPLGFLYTNGKKRGSLNKSSLGSGVFQVKNGRPSIIRRQTFSAEGVTEALQSGPFLVRSGSSVPGLSNQRPRDRSILLTDGGANWAIAQTSPCSLSQLGSALLGKKIDHWTIKNALNLDGGRSCDLFISASLTGTHQTHRSFIAKPVRNFLVIVPK